ncbi:hypothetical protein CALCODRAFT_525450 [Calocera cornea HHB12733]|uniref:BSD domain-containing protein n=1 Tax=Calocera cornea HHB12733 TaxID=1353952 RepID=A0A165D7U4_9BASI|nr:hypothetical protein CALCODRAFT_525450 [Calocera cornea HHB12733]
MSAYAAGPSTPTPNGAKKWLTRAPATYNKLPGTLFLSPDRLVWKQDGVPQPPVNVQLLKASAIFNSKEGALPVRLKVVFTDNEKGFQFAFSSPTPSEALAQRAEFVAHLTPIINRNKSLLSGSPGSAPATPAPGPSTPGAERSATPGAPGAATAIGQENALRRSVLLSHPDLAALHKDLVISGQLSESEFWHGRAHLLSAARAQAGQKRGRASQLVDPKPQTGEGGDIKIVITPQLVHDIFEEFPVVARAYSENVPNEMSESAFWARYFQSALFNQNRASTRSSAPQHIVKPDPILDRYLEPDDDGSAPRQIFSTAVDRLLDLGATEEDHEETGNERDVTMQPGRERGILPLIRRFNVHSERLLQQALGEAPAGKRRKLEGGMDERFDPNDYYDEIVLDDLIDHHASTGVQLDLLNSSLFSTSTTVRKAAGDDAPVRTPSESRALLADFRAQTADYLRPLHALKPARKAADAALQAMTASVQRQHAAHAALPPIPAEFFRQMTTCQTAANEFLRQFWGAVLPPPPPPPPIYAGVGSGVSGGERLGLSNRERAQKAQKMAGYLARTGEKVDALVSAARGEGVDPERVRAAFGPLMSAVDKALKLYAQRRKKT